MSVDFPYTCPRIDRCISDMKTILKDQLEDLVKELNPMFFDSVKVEDRNNYIDGWVGVLYDELEPQIEEVRTTNEELRSSVGSQIEDMEDKVNALESERDVIESDYERMKEERDELESKIQELEEQLTRFERIAV